jgi:hypothetical protein
VDGEDVVRQGVERSDGGRKEKQTASAEDRDPALGTVASNGDGVAESQCDDGERRLGMKRPGIRIRL